MRWRRLADLPCPLSNPYAVINQSRIFVTGSVPSHNHTHAIFQVYCYDCSTNQWCLLPPLQQYYGVPHIVGGKLAIFGGRLSPTSKRTSKVSTFDQLTHSWTSFYPDMMSVRSRPGVVTYLEYVIVAGGTVDDAMYCVKDIEILNWVENHAWRMLSLSLPFPMFALSPIVCNDNIYIVGFSNKGGSYRNAYMIPAACIASPLGNSSLRSWQKLKSSECNNPMLIPGLSPPVIVGNQLIDQTCKISSTDIYIYNIDTKSWEQVDKLSSPRLNPAVVSMGNNAIVVIGGSVRQKDSTRAICLSTVELGQVELIIETTM